MASTITYFPSVPSFEIVTDPVFPLLNSKTPSERKSLPCLGTFCWLIRIVVLPVAWTIVMGVVVDRLEL